MGKYQNKEKEEIREGRYLNLKSLSFVGFVQLSNRLVLVISNS